MNYTRPLASKFVELGHSVKYLYSGTWNSKYDFRFKPYIHYNRTDFTFECAEIINSDCLSYNYGHAELDVACPSVEKLVASHIENTKPDVVHIHSRVGFPASINKIAFERGAAVCNTIHTYGYICQKRVMIDRNGDPCAGPADLRKCAACTGTLDYGRERRRLLSSNYKGKLKKISPGLFTALRKIKAHMEARGGAGVKTAARVAPGQMSDDALDRLAKRLGVRLKHSIASLNESSDRVICVSQDVRDTLKRYGVREEKMLVQHIGSVIAERQRVEERPLRRPLVLGNIGGVNHYKGTHVLLEAAARTKNKDFIVKIFGKYDQHYVDRLRRKIDKVPVEFTGRYRPEDLPKILKQIDVMVLPSICNDTAPQTIFESFSGGVPIIASRIGGFPDFVRHDENGLLFEAGNSGDLAEKIDHLLDHPERIARYRANIPRLKTIEENARELVSLYEGLLGRKGAANHAMRAS